MKTITGTVNFWNLSYNKNDFYRDLEKYGIELVKEEKSFFTYTFTLRGRDEDLDHARWYFTHG